MNTFVQSVTISSVHWFADDSEPVELRCPVCREKRRNAPLLQVPSMADGSSLTLFTCAACGSKFFDPPGIRDFSDILGEGKHFWKSYVEVVGGIWEMYWPAACSSRKPSASLLDVGCGFGFTVDAWRRLRGEAVGVELADYGRAGAEQLGIPIHFDYLENIPALDARRFGVVYASEVIEHVPDARAFADLLSRYLADDGVLCLTTPNAEFIREANAGPTLIAALSPGFHGFLIGPAEMENLLRSCGFAHVLVRPIGERLVAWASRHALEIDESSPEVRAEYLRYLEEVLASREQNDLVTDGIAYRHFRDTVLAQNFDAASGSLARLESSLKEKYQADLLDPDKTLERIHELASADDYNAAYPWFLPNLYFVRGIYAKVFERNEHAARGYFRASRQLATHISDSWGALFVLEALSFVPDAWQQEAVSAALEGDPSVCVEWIASIADAARRLAPALGGSRLSRRQVEHAYLEGLSILGALNCPEAHGAALDACLLYLGNTYGDWLRVEPGAAEGVPGAGLPHEQRMLFHLTLAISCSQLGAHADLVRPLLERVLQLAKMQGVPSALANAITADAQARLAAIAPNPNRWGGSNAGMTSSMSYSFRSGSKPK